MSTQPAEKRSSSARVAPEKPGLKFPRFFTTAGRHPFEDVVWETRAAVITDEKGNFEIKNAPAGKYRLQVWHEGYGFVQKNKNNRGIIITIEGGKTTTIDRELVKED